MTPEALLNRLADLFPSFREYWDGPDNYHRDCGGSDTLHGVFSAFSLFCQERYAMLPADRVAALGAFVSESIAQAADRLLRDAAISCFVENVAGDPCDRELSPHLTGEARRYWLAWGGVDGDSGAD